MMSSDEDENGKMKKHKMPFSPTKRVTFDTKGKLLNVHEPVIPKSVNTLVNPGVKIKDYFIDEDGSVYSGQNRSVAASAKTNRSANKKPKSPNATAKKKKVQGSQGSLDDNITAKVCDVNQINTRIRAVRHRSHCRANYSLT